MECLANQQAFITLKDHKDNFQNNLTCRLINPTKSEMGLISKQILERAIIKIRNDLRVNQWRNTSSVIEWFENIQNKNQCTFTVFDIEEFYPSISEELLNKAIEFATHTEISEEEKRIIHHARKSLLFDKNKPRVKKNNASAFDVTVGS